MRCPFCTNNYVHVAQDTFADSRHASCAQCKGHFTITREDMEDSPSPIAASMGVPVKLPAIHERARAAWMEEQAKLTVALLGVSRKDADELADEKEHAAKPSGGPFPPPAGMALKERFPPPEEEGRLDPFEEALKLARGL